MQQQVSGTQTFLEHSRKNPAKDSNTTKVPSSHSAAEVGMVQATLENTFKEYWKINDWRARALTYRIFEMIAIDNQ